MTDQTTPETTDGDDFPPVRFTLRNMSGDAAAIELHQPMLGLDRYALLTTGDDAFQLEASHLSMDDLAVALAIVLASALQSEHVSDDIREMVVACITDED